MEKEENRKHPMDQHEEILVLLPDIKSYVIILGMWKQLEKRL